MAGWQCASRHPREEQRRLYSVSVVVPKTKLIDMLTRFASSRVVVEAGRDEGAATGSTKDITSNMGTLRVAVDNDVSARALGVQGSNLRDTVAGTLSDLGAVVSTEGDIELDIDVVAGLALSIELGASCIDEGGGPAIVVRGIVATSHKDDYISALCVELGRSSLSSSEGSSSTKGEGVADERHDYILGIVACIKASINECG